MYEVARGIVVAAESSSALFLSSPSEKEAVNSWHLLIAAAAASVSQFLSFSCSLLLYKKNECTTALVVGSTLWLYLAALFVSCFEGDLFVVLSSFPLSETESFSLDLCHRSVLFACSHKKMRDIATCLAAAVDIIPESSKKIGRECEGQSV